MNAENSREDQLMAGLCHASLLVPVLGVSVPLVVWLSQRPRSPLLRFQALQALAYQVVGLVSIFLLGSCQWLGWAGFFPVSILMAALSQVLPSHPGSAQEFSTFFGAILALFFLLLWILSLLLFFLQCFLGPLYVLLGLWAAGRVLAGRSFRYPILGYWIARKLQPVTRQATKESAYDAT